MANPGDGDLTVIEPRKRWLPMLTGSPRQERFPDHFTKKRAWVKMFCRRQILEGAGQRLLRGRRPIRCRSGHIAEQDVTADEAADKIQFAPDPRFVKTTP